MKRNNMVSLSLVIHNHQPVDNDPEIIDKIYRKSYLPFLETISRYPKIKISLHYTGYLLSWIEKKYPEFISKLRHMINVEQVEILGGGFYEPIFSVLPEKDIVGQTDFMKSYLVRLLGTNPEGCWLAERVWEPNLPEILQKCGVKFTLLDDSLFTRSGLEYSDCFQPFITESRGSTVTVFPILKKLRYLIPFENPASTISFLKNNPYLQNESAKLAVFADDGEKFGGWPDTYRLVHEKKWLESFFELIESNSRWLRTITLGQYLKELVNLSGPVYLPAGSYDEMDSWSLSVQSKSNASSYRKGYWRMFLSKYRESGRLYSRMLGVSAEIDASDTLDKRRGKTPLILRKINSARMELWKSQFNDVYWHGVFGGLYLPELRKTAYGHLINAQKILHGARSKREGKREGKGKGELEIKRKDSGNISIDSDTLGIYISARDGGTIQEIDFKPKSVNVTDTITRIEEAYHSEFINNQSGPMGKKISSIVTGMRGKIKGGNFHTNIVYDKYPRYSFRDYILHANTDIADFENQRYIELAPLSVQNCRIETILKRRKDMQFSLSRQSQLQDTAMSGKAKFAITKIIAMYRARPSLSVSYLLSTESNKGPLRGIFASEINLGSLGAPKFVKTYDRIREVEKCGNIEIKYEELGFSLEFIFSPSTSLWMFPVKTVSKSEEGIESKVQGLSIVPHWPVESILGKRVEVNLRFY